MVETERSASGDTLSLVYSSLSSLDYGACNHSVEVKAVREKKRRLSCFHDLIDTRTNFNFKWRITF